MSIRYTSDDYNITEIADPERRRLNDVRTKYDYHVYGLAGRPDRKHIKITAPSTVSFEVLNNLFIGSGITTEIVYEPNLTEILIGMRRDIRTVVTYGNAMLRMIITFAEGKLTIPEAFVIPAVPAELPVPPTPAPAPTTTSSPDDSECNCDVCREARGEYPLPEGHEDRVPDDECDAPSCSEDDDDMGDAGDNESDDETI